MFSEFCMKQFGELFDVYIYYSWLAALKWATSIGHLKKTKCWLSSSLRILSGRKSQKSSEGAREAESNDGTKSTLDSGSEAGRKKRMSILLIGCSLISKKGYLHIIHCEKIDADLTFWNALSSWRSNCETRCFLLDLIFVRRKNRR